MAVAKKRTKRVPDFGTPTRRVIGFIKTRVIGFTQYISSKEKTKK